MRSTDTNAWHPASWQSRKAAQQPQYEDAAALERTVAELSRLPPIVVSWEVEKLREELAAAQRGEAFLLQGGDCAETFADCESDRIAKQLKVLLQMSLVLLSGLKRPVIRVGRMAGQYAKPRSAEYETRDGVTLPAYRGDIVNHIEFTAEGRRADPVLLLRGYERAALTLTSCAHWSMAALPICITRNTGIWHSCATRRCARPMSAPCARSATRWTSSSP